MSDTKAREGLELLRYNLIHSATPNMKLAIENKAPIAALVYGLALIDTMAGFFYGVEAKKQAKRGDGVGIRYEKFIEEYLSPGHSNGHDFHKTRQQRTNDAKRDRYLQMNGWQVIRFTGTEIHRDVFGCIEEAKKIIEGIQNRSES